MSVPSPTPPSLPLEIILLPADAFFVRWLPLVAGAEVGPQVEIALENLSPFPRSQLYAGFLLSPARTSALVFAAYQKRFSREETARWPAAKAVLPDFLGLLGEAPAKSVIRVWHHDGCCAAAAWDGRESLPVALVVGPVGAGSPAAAAAALCADLRLRTGLELADVHVYHGAGPAEYDGRKNIIRFSLRPESTAAVLTTSLAVAAVDTADVRDREFLVEQRRQRRRDLRLWHGFVGCLGGLAAALVLEVGLVAGRPWLARARAEIQQRAEGVSRIETAQRLSTRIEELTQMQLRPFEMLALANQFRPASIQFIRTVTVGMNNLEIEAQTGNAADVSPYETKLRGAPEVAGIVTRDLRSRNGVTSFILTITFKPEALRPEVRP